MRVAEIDAIRVSMVQVRTVFGFAERHLLGVNIHILPHGPHCQAKGH